MFRRLLIIIIAFLLLGTLLFYTVEDKLNSTGEVGSRGRDFLKSFPYFGVTVEVDYQTGMQPNPASLQKFVGFVQQHTRKSVEIIQSEIPGTPPPEPGMPVNSSDTFYNRAQIIDLYAKNRNVFPFPGSISLYIIYLDKQSEDKSVVGTSFCATCIAIFKPVINLFGTTNMEAVTLAHEFGHILGLMCLSYPVSADSSCDGSGHSNDMRSLMYRTPNWANRDVQNLILLPNELADLEGLRSGRL